jgi:hypothetical protein
MTWIALGIHPAAFAVHQVNSLAFEVLVRSMGCTLEINETKSEYIIFIRKHVWKIRLSLDC